MTEQQTDPAAVLRAFAQLTETGVDRDRVDVLADPTLITPMRYSSNTIFQDGQGITGWSLAPEGILHSVSAQDRHVLAAARLQEGGAHLRMGWLWFAGTAEREGRTVQYCFPAISIPVQADVAMLSVRDVRLSPAGEASATRLISDPVYRDDLLDRAEFGGGALTDGYRAEGATPQYQPIDGRLLPHLTQLRGWVDELAETLGLDLRERMAVHEVNPAERRHGDGIGVIIGTFLYVDHPTEHRTTSESLMALSKLPGIEETAFAKVYGEPTSIGSSWADVTELRPLSLGQRKIAKELFGNDLAVLSGPPGTGKTHLVTLLAHEAVANDKSVLVAASSDHSVDVLVEHFMDSPGPTPLVFGNSKRSRDLADRFRAHSSWVPLPGSDDLFEIPPAPRERNKLKGEIYSLLAGEVAASTMLDNPDLLQKAEADLQVAGDLCRWTRTLFMIEHFGMRGRILAMMSKRRRKRAFGTGDQSQRLNELFANRCAVQLISGDGLSLNETFDALVKAGEATAQSEGDLVTEGWLKGLNRRERAALSKVAQAMSATGSKRRRSFRSEPAALFNRAAPLWVGSIQDIDEVLPRIAGMFDLVILDEASQIDQVNAANALVRANTAIISGDPRQLGHRSFFGRDKIEEVAQQHGLQPELINGRKSSIHDAVAAVAPTSVLDEHFRSVPHLVEFSARRFYNNSLHPVTRHPSNESANHIDIHVVDGVRDDDGVNHEEVAKAMRVADELISDGWDSIGFMSPFRAQADALERAALEKYSLKEIDDFGFRVGTAHSFQGAERRVMIMSWAVGPNEPEKAWRFVNQPNLFNVMVTRAEERAVVVTSAANPPGLAGDYVRWAEPFANTLSDAGVVHPWVGEVASALRTAGVPVRAGYRVGRYCIDVVAGSGEGAVGIDCVPHAFGPEAHIDRALQLRRMGWRTADAYESRWRGKLSEYVVELLTRFPDAGQ